MRRRKSGFTLIELLVVISIIAVLVALLLPAIQQARESARRSNCRANIKQIGLAMQNYHSQWGSFPVGSQATSDPGGMWNWRRAILPYIDQQALYDKLTVGPTGNTYIRTDRIDFYDLSKNTCTIGTCAGVLRDVTIKLYECPSTRLPRRSIDSINGQMYPMVDYTAIAGAVPSVDKSGTVTGSWIPKKMPNSFFGIERSLTAYDSAGNNSWVANNGAFPPNASTPITGFRDGTSVTLLVGEQSGLINAAFPTWSRHVYSETYGGWSGGYLRYTGFSDPDSYNFAKLAAKAATQGYKLTRNPEIYGYTPGCTTIYHTPNPTYGNQPWEAGGWKNYGGDGAADHPQDPAIPITSEHGGGVNAVFADGHVTFLSDQIDLDMLKRMAVRSDGLPIEGEF